MKESAVVCELYWEISNRERETWGRRWGAHILTWRELRHPFEPKRPRHTKKIFVLFLFLSFFLFLSSPFLFQSVSYFWKYSFNSTFNVRSSCVTIPTCLALAASNLDHFILREWWRGERDKHYFFNQINIIFLIIFFFVWSYYHIQYLGEIKFLS